MDFAVKRFPHVFLLGSYARDFDAHGVANLKPGRRTVDADFAVEVAYAHRFTELVEGLTPLRGTGLCFTVDGFQLDLIPFGGVESEGIIEPQEGMTLDVTGMSEAHEHAVQFALRDGLVVRCLISLRSSSLRSSPGTIDRSAIPKTGTISTCSSKRYAGEYGDEVWNDTEVVDLVEWLPELIGPFRVARRVPERYPPDVVDRVRRVVDGDSADANVASLQIQHDFEELARERVRAFASGIAPALGRPMQLTGPV